MEKKTVEQIMADAEAKADELIAKSSAVREYYNTGRPNNARESTVLGSLKALEIILEGWPPEPEGETTQR